MQSIDASLTVRLRIADATVTGVDIHSTRLVQASRLLAGRTPAQVTAILPTIYALCGTAQALAGCSAMEAALGLTVGPAHRMARSLLLRLETVSEHAQGILRDWPALLDEAPDLALIKPLRPMLTAAKRALYPDGDWTLLGGGRLAVDRGALIEQMKLLSGVAAHLFAGSPEDWSADLAVIGDWIERGEATAARLLRRIKHDGLSGFGRSPLRLMPDGGPRDLEPRLVADGDGAYVTRPDSGGTVLETNALSRQYAQPLIADLMARHGGGLVPRLIARLVEIAAALRELEELVQDLCDAPRAGSEARNSGSGSGSGLGMVDAARGLLVHRVEIEEGMVSRYQILAPTEWNFHPQGPLHAGLLGSEAGPDLERRARLLVAALDPCVACTIEVVSHA